jgi:hypothetical protein
MAEVAVVWHGMSLRSSCKDWDSFVTILIDSCKAFGFQLQTVRLCVKANAGAQGSKIAEGSGEPEHLKGQGILMPFLQEGWNLLSCTELVPYPVS